MDLTNFQQRILGFPAQAEDDLSRARWGQMGQIGLALLGASGRMPAGQRGAALAAGLSQVQDPQQVAMNYAQQRLMQSVQQAKMDEINRNSALRQKLTDPAYLKGLGMNPQAAEVLGPEGIANVIQAQAARDPLDRQVKQAQIAALQRRDDPKWGQIGVNADGQPTYGYIPAWNGEGSAPTPSGMPTAHPPAAAGQAVTEPAIPPGVNGPEYRKKLADEQAKLEATKIAKKRAEQEDYVPAFNDYVSTFEKAAKAGAIGPMQANAFSRSVWANSENENLRQQVEAAQKRWAYAQALRTYGKLDRGFTDTELQAFLQQGLPLYSADPTSALEGFKRRFGSSEAAPSPAASSVPQRAAEALRANPALRDQFDAKYGPGASAKVLGQ